jgi:hypothetical protein
MTTRDSRRAFTRTQQKEIWEQQGGKCAKCFKKLSLITVQYHHLRGWAENGKTLVKNGAALCADYHSILSHKERLKKVERKKTVPKPAPIISLNELNVIQLKSLAKKHHMAPKTIRIIRDIYGEHKLPPTKRQYLNILTGIVTTKEIDEVRKAVKLIKR